MLKLPPFVAPKFSFGNKRLVEIPFIGNVGAGGFLTLVAGRISYPFRILCLKMIFIDAAANLVEHGWFTSNNLTVSVTGPPSDENIFGRESPTALFIGRGIIRVVNTNIEYPDGMLYIKLYTHNGSAAAYAVNCSIIIQEM